MSCALIQFFDVNLKDYPLVACGHMTCLLGKLLRPFSLFGIYKSSSNLSEIQVLDLDSVLAHLDVLKLC